MPRCDFRGYCLVMVLKDLLLVGAGGALGSMSRFAVSILMQPWLASTGFPWGTLTVNILGCFAIGWLFGPAGSAGALSRSGLLMAGAGFLGGFTTFSAFGYETVSLMRSGKVLLAGTNVLAQLVLGLAAAWIGVMVASNRSPGTL